MYAEDLVVDDNRQRQKVKHVGEIVPHIRIAVLSGALGVEAVRLSHTARLVVATNEVDSVWVA